MKKNLTLILLLFFSWSTARCQWTSAGNGTTYTLRDLVESSEGCVTYNDTLEGYLLHANLTIAPNDCLKIVPDDCQTNIPDAVGIYSDGDILLTIQGSIRIDNEETRVYFLHLTETDHFRLHIENSEAASLIKNTVFFRISGIQVNESAVRFDNCYFQETDLSYQRGAVTYSNCDPVFNDCVFQGNYGPALYSDAQTMGSPQITRCEFRYNVLSKQYMPQLDLGPGSEDTIRIVDSRVVGLYPPVGGISIIDTLQVGDTKLLLKGNFIADNRYGYHQQGYAIDALIVNNEIICNQIETNPMNGGSGINIHGTSINCKAKIRNNLIKNNLWGITIVADAVVDLGSEDNYGYNMIFNNHNDSDNGDRLYALYVRGNNDVTAVGNYWGGTTEDYAESVIFHRPDLGEDYGLVSFTPILTVNSWNLEENNTLKTTIFPNPTNGQVTLRVDTAEGFSYEVFNLMGQKVMSGLVNGSETVIDLGSCSAGIYLVSITANHKTNPVFQQIIR